MDWLSNKRRIRNKKRTVIVLIILLMLFLIAIKWLTHLVVLDDKIVQSYDLPRKFHNKKIVFASDFLYDGTNASYINSTITKINSCRADVVILGGNFGINPEKSIEFFDIIPIIHANVAVVAVLGEYDVDKNNRNDYNIKNKLNNKGIYLLVNELYKLRIEDESINIYGYDELANINSEFGNGIDKNKTDDFNVLVANSYNKLDKIISNTTQEDIKPWCDLALFGGTLGGQYFFVPDIKSAFDPVKAPRYFTGWHEEKRIKILVSNGIGTLGIPIRLFVPPQVHIISLKYK